MTEERVFFLKSDSLDDSGKFINELRKNSPEALERAVFDIPDSLLDELCEAVKKHGLSVRQSQIAFAIVAERLKCTKIK